MVSGYGYNTVLACLSNQSSWLRGRCEPHTQGRKLDTKDVLDFGKAALLNFHPILSSDFGWVTVKLPGWWDQVYSLRLKLNQCVTML